MSGETMKRVHDIAKIPALMWFFADLARTLSDIKYGVRVGIGMNRVSTSFRPSTRLWETAAGIGTAAEHNIRRDRSS